MKQQNLQVMNNSYRTLIKAFDFIAINILLTFILSFHGFTETAIDLSAGLLFSTVYLLISEYLGLYVIDTQKNLVTYLLKSIVSLSLAVAIYSMLKLRLLDLDGIEISNLSPSIYFQLYLLTFVILSLARRSFY